MAGAIGIAQAVEAAGFRRYWVSEHHNMRSLACSAPEILIAAVAARTKRIRVGAAGIMLPNHSPFKVAEIFRTLLALHPGRIDLGLGRAPGTDPLTAHVLRRGANVDVASEFPGQVAEPWRSSVTASHRAIPMSPWSPPLWWRNDPRSSCLARARTGRASPR